MSGVGIGYFGRSTISSFASNGYSGRPCKKPGCSCKDYVSTETCECGHSKSAHFMIWTACSHGCCNRFKSKCRCGHSDHYGVDF